MVDEVLDRCSCKISEVWSLRWWWWEGAVEGNIFDIRGWRRWWCSVIGSEICASTDIDVTPELVCKSQGAFLRFACDTSIFVSDVLDPFTQSTLCDNQFINLES